MNDLLSILLCTIVCMLAIHSKINLAIVIEQQSHLSFFLMTFQLLFCCGWLTSAAKQRRWYLAPWAIMLIVLSLDIIFKWHTSWADRSNTGSASTTIVHTTPKQPQWSVTSKRKYWNIFAVWKILPVCLLLLCWRLEFPFKYVIRFGSI